MYRVEYRNSTWVTKSSEVVETRSKVRVREVIERARKYPGSYEILEITKTTKARGTEFLSVADF